MFIFFTILALFFTSHCQTESTLINYNGTIPQGFHYVDLKAGTNYTWVLHWFDWWRNGYTVANQASWFQIVLYAPGQNIFNDWD